MSITSMAVDDLASLDAASVDDACEVSHLERDDNGSDDDSGDGI